MSSVGTQRTYEPVKLHFGQSRVLCQVDSFTGQTVSRDKETETQVSLEVELELRGVRVGFEAIGSIHQKGFDPEKLVAKLKAALVREFPKRVLWELYRTPEIRLKPDDPELGVWEAEATVEDMMAPKFEEQAKAGQEAIAGLRAAIADLEEGLKDEDRRKVQSGLSYLQSFHQANNCGMMYLWCQEKLPGIRHGVADLNKRKDRNHPNYTRTLDNVLGWIHSWPMRNCWHREPPRKYTSP